jgi:hypothetical protein
MNYTIDTDPESFQCQDSKLLKLVEVLIDKIITKLENDSFEPRVQDALKAIQLKQKVVKTSEAEKIFWQEIDAIRESELTRLYAQPFNLEDQIRTTILDLKDQVRNGILPVKTITDAFNQDRSEEGHLTYHRIGRLLSTMGFTKAKTQNGSSAIIWDDKLLLGPPDKGDDRGFMLNTRRQELSDSRPQHEPDGSCLRCEPNDLCDRTDHKI